MARAYLTLGSLLAITLDELPNITYTYDSSMAIN